MNRPQRALACAVGIIPATISNLVLLQCGRSGFAYALEIATAAFYFAWILLAKS